MATSTACALVRASETLFREACPDLVEAVEASGTHQLFFVDEFEERVGIGRGTVVICKHIETGRGWGIHFRVDARRCDGLKGRIYRADLPDSAASRDFMAEWCRRLQVRGIGLVEAGGHVAGDGIFVKPLPTTKAALEKHAY